MASMSMGRPGYLNPGSRYAQLMQVDPSVNNGSLGGGLAYALQSWMAGQAANRERGDMRQAQQAMVGGLQPWKAPDNIMSAPPETLREGLGPMPAQQDYQPSVVVPKGQYAPGTGGYEGAVRALDALGPGNEYAGRLSSDLMLQKAQADMERQAKLDMFRMEQSMKPPTTRTYKKDGQEITQEYNPADQSWKDLGSSPQFAPERPPSAVQEYEFAKSQGYPGTFTEFQLAQRKAGAGNTNVTVGGRYGTIPPGWMLKESPEGASMVPIPGGPAEREVRAADDKTALQQGQTQRSADIVLEDIGRARGLVKNAAGIPVTGLGSYLSVVPGSRAGDLSKTLDTIKSNVGFDKLNQMRQASPTGGALGSVTERELALLQSTLGNLEQSQSEEQFLINLDRLERVYSEIINGPAAVPPSLNSRPGQPRDVPSRPGFKILDVQ